METNEKEPAEPAKELLTEEKNIQKAVEKIQKDTNDILNLEQVKELIKNNIKEFEHQDIKYRVQKPNFEQKYEVSKQQSKKYIEMLKDPDYVLESALIEIYKKRKD